MAAIRGIDMRRLGLIAFGCAVSATALMGASAQDTGMFNRDQNTSVMERPRPEYQAGGIQRGAFIFTPRMTADLEFNDNIYATATNEQSDTIAVLNPTLNIASTWSRHYLSANASVTRREYFDFSDESVTDFSLGVDGGIDIGMGWTAGLGAGYDSLHEPRTSAGAAGRAAEPISYDTSSVYASLVREVGRTRFTGSAAYDTYDYDDAPLIGGGVADQDGRDRNEILGEFRGDYAISPDTAVFGRIRYINQEYTSTTAGGTTRDQDGYTLDVGANFDLSNLVRGEVGIGYLTRSFDDPAFDDVNGLSVDGQVEWFITPLTTITAFASRGLQPAAVANSPAFISTAYGARVDHELRRNVILSAGFDLGEDDYEGIDRTDDRSNITLSGTYLLNRYVGVSLDFVNTQQDSSGVNGQPDFEVNKVLIGVILQR